MNTKSLPRYTLEGPPFKANDQQAAKDALRALLDSALGLMNGLPYGGASARKAKPNALAKGTLDELATLLADIEHPAADLVRVQLTATLAQVTANRAAGRQTIKSAERPPRPPATAVSRSAENEDDAEISTEEAASLLFVSRPYVVKLLDSGKIPLAQKTVGGQRRVKKAEVLKYKAAMKDRQTRALDEMVAASEELDLYAADPTPPVKPPKRKAR